MVNIFRIEDNTNISFEDYTKEKYFKDIETYGMQKLWQLIIKTNIETPLSENSLINYKNFGLLYELGLAYINKKDKQKVGAYYTPIDVANLLSDFLIDLNGENICDVACGTGNLILSVLNNLGKEKAYDLLIKGKVFLYDTDSLALSICRHTIALIYGKETFDKIHCCSDNFLKETTKLPTNSKVISNPPYFKIDTSSIDFSLSEIANQSKELYAAFMEKIIKNSVSSVLITPYSFLHGNKFSKLRYFLNEYSGYLFSFDNVPGNIFNGNKIGTLSSSNRNSVRTTISVVNNSGENGFQVSQLIRFHNSERKKMLSKTFLLSIISEKKQIISVNHPIYCKQFKTLEKVYENWQNQSSGTLRQLTCEDSTYVVYMPHACRYFTCGVTHPLQRSMRDIIYAKDEKSFYFLYTILNSSFAYWYGRMFDGGINFSSNLALKMPSFIDKVTDKQFEEMKELVNFAILNEKQYIVKKLNAGSYQENVKFPVLYRRDFDSILLKILDLGIDITNFDKPYSKTILKVSGVEEYAE